MVNILYYQKVNEASHPFRATTNSAGLDLASIKAWVIEPGQTVKVDTGIRIKLPENSYGRVCGRSRTFLDGLSIFDGVIDPDYQGTIKIVVTNNWKYTQNFIDKGERIAQLIVQPFILPTLAQVESIEDTSKFTIQKTIPNERHERGFGSSGIF